MLRRILTLTFAGFVALHVSEIALAQQHVQRKDVQLENDISALKKDVATIGGEQHQIIEQLNELRRLITANAGRPGAQPPTPPSSLAIQGEAFRGDASATVAIIEYADFECPYCGQYEHETFPQILSDYIETGKVKYFYRDLPLPMHPHAMGAARAARCAGEQGKYWEMHDSLFANQRAIRDADMPDRAQELGLDTAKFAECLSSERYTDDIRKSISEAQKLGIDGTPTFFVGTIDDKGEVVKIDKAIVGAVPYENFKSELDALLASKAQP